MRPALAQKAAALFEALVELPEAARVARLRALSDSLEVSVLAEVRSLLDADAREGEFLADPSTDGDAPPEDRAGPYRLGRKLGEGGMSEVFLGIREDGELARQVAIKLVREELLSPVMIRRFEIERQILANLEHPSISALLDAGRTASGRPYFVMELLEGEPIDRYCDERRLPLGERIKLFREVCGAVHFAHQNLVIHRDIKPSNVMVTAEGRPKLLDFGIAKLLDPDGAPGKTDLTRRFERLMTPEYASPEQREGRPVSTASDVYSLGAVLYKLLTGKLPRGESSRSPGSPDSEAIELPSSTFRERGWGDGETAPPGQKLSSRAAARSGSPRSLARELSGDLDAIVLRSLRPEEGSRYGSAEQLGEDLGRYLEAEPVLARRGGWRYRFRRLLRRHRLAASLVASVAILVTAAVALLAIQSFRLKEERNRARLERDRAQEVTVFLNRLFELGNPELGGAKDLTLHQVLEEAVQRVEVDLEGQPDRQASLAMTLAEALTGVGSPRAAVPLVEKALENRRRLFGEDSLPVAESLFFLGRLSRHIGETETSQRSQRQAYEIFVHRLGAQSLEAAKSQVELGLLLVYEAEAVGAVVLLEEALAIHRALPEISTDDLADAVEALGIAYHEAGRFEAARASFEEAVELRRESGDHELLLSNSRALLAATLIEVGDFGEAERLMVENLEVEDRILGPRQQNRPIRFHNLAALMFRQRDYERSAAYGRKGLEAAREVLAPDHLYLERVLRGLASSLRELGRHDEAEPLLRELVALRRARLPAESPEIAHSELRLGLSLLELGQHPEAGDLLRRSWSVLRQAPASYSPLARQALQGLIRWERAQGHREAAERLERELGSLPGNS